MWKTYILGANPKQASGHLLQVQSLQRLARCIFCGIRKVRKPKRNQRFNTTRPKALNMNHLLAGARTHTDPQGEIRRAIHSIYIQHCRMIGGSVVPSLSPILKGTTPIELIMRTNLPPVDPAYASGSRQPQTTLATQLIRNWMYPTTKTKRHMDFRKYLANCFGTLTLKSPGHNTNNFGS